MYSILSYWIKFNMLIEFIVKLQQFPILPLRQNGIAFLTLNVQLRRNDNKPNKSLKESHKPPGKQPFEFPL